MENQLQTLEPAAKVLAATALSQSYHSVRSVNIWKK